MPTKVDTEPTDGGEPLSLFESGAIMFHLAEKHGQYLKSDVQGRHEVNQWVNWPMANQGPKLAEYEHFLRVDQGKERDQSYATRQFTDEANRIYGVLNNALYRNKYIAGDDYTIADMICYP